MSIARRLACASSCLVVLLAGCGSGMTVLEGGDSFPAESLSDWKSYADHVVVFTVESERELPVGEAEAATGEGLVGREITIRIEETLWSAEGAPALPAAVPMVTSGWVLRDGDREEATFDGAPRPAPGERYLSPMVHYDTVAPGEWGPLTLSSQMRLEDGRVARGDSSSPVQDELAGGTVEEVAAAVRAAPADPVAARFKDLRPMERVQAVQREAAGG